MGHRLGGREFLGGVHAGAPEQIVVSGSEAIGIAVVLGEQPETEQQPVGVGPVVEVTAVVVRLEHPHVRMGRRLIEPVAIGVALSLQHDLVQLGGAEGAALAPGEHLGLEQEPAPDVDGSWYSLDHHFVIEVGDNSLPKPPITGKADWQFRAYGDDPKATVWGGSNVYDVTSKSDGTALDGTKYKTW